jgi:hypothetical protein
MRPLVPMLVANLSNDDGRTSGFVDGETRVSIPHGVYVRLVSAEILGAIGPDASSAVNALTLALEDRPGWIHFPNVVPGALGQIGPGASNAIPALQRVMHSDETVRAAYAAEALWRIDSGQKAAVTSFLVNTLSSSNCFARLKAARVHWAVNSQPEIVLPVLIGLMRDSANHWIYHTLLALEDLGPAGADAAAVVSEKLSDTDADVSRLAAEVLEQIQPGGGSRRVREE